MSGRPVSSLSAACPRRAVPSAGADTAIMGSVHSTVCSTSSSRSGVRTTDTSIIPASRELKRENVVPSCTSKLASGFRRAYSAMNGIIGATVDDVSPSRSMRRRPKRSTSCFVESA